MAMNRRGFLKATSRGVALLGFAPELVFAKDLNINHLIPSRPQDKHFLPKEGKDVINESASSCQIYDERLKDYISKIKNFDQDHGSDIFLDDKSLKLLKSILRRIKRINNTIGYANFNLVTLDHTFKIARNYRRIGSFHKAELNFLEMIFHEEAYRYGFFGEKPLKKMTQQINKREVIKVPQSGHYLYRGAPYKTYLEIKKVLGEGVILTSGVRNIMKQFLLFLNKANKHKGNLSLASRSLAPPGYSFHGIGDFDVGKPSFGVANFTERFTTTDVYKKLQELGYLELRYPDNNLLGVRFEPWHVKI